MAKLTPKQKKFCDEYLIDLNATQAAIRAGYSKKTAKEIAAQNLSKLNIQEYIGERQKEREKRTEITQDNVLRELAAIAFAKESDFAKVVERDSVHTIEKEDGTLIEIHYITDGVRITPTDQLSEQNKKALAGIKRTRNGISVETHDKTKALELLGRHLGLFNDKLEIKGDLNNPFEALSTDELKKLIGDG